MYSFDKNSILLIRKTLLIILSFISIFFPSSASPQTQIKHIKQDIYTRFTDFTPLLGHSCGTIIDIEQDKTGNIWLAGTKGLAQFNGNSLRYFHHDWTPGSLPSSAVYCLEPDEKGKLWIGTRNGLCYYDYKKDIFKKVIGPDTNQIVSDTFFVRKILAEGDSLLWFDTQQGYLWKLDLRTLNVKKQFRHQKARQRYYYYHALFRDNDNLLWVGGRTIGPYYLDEKNNRTIQLPNSNYAKKEGMKLGPDVAYFFNDAHNNLWIGSTDGIYLYDKTNARFNMFYKTSSWAISADHEGNVWFGISGGIARYHPSSGELTTFYPSVEDRESLLGRIVFDIFEDSYHQIWVATDKGVSVLKKTENGVNYLFHIPGTPETATSSSFTCLTLDSSGMVWAGTENNGLECYDPQNNSFCHYNMKNVAGMPTNKIRSITISPDNKVFCGLWAGVGFGILNPDKRTFLCYTFYPENRQKDWYNDLEFDQRGNLYLGFWGGPGLTLFNHSKETFGKSLKTRFHPTFSSRLITALQLDDRGNLWMGTTDAGPHLYFPKEDTAISYINLLNKKEALDLQKVFEIKKGNAGSIWIGAQGLYHVNVRNPRSLQKIKLDERYDHLEIYDLLPEEKMLVWLLTDRGLLRYNHLSGGISNYSSIVKLRFDEKHTGAVRLKDGRFMFAGSNGLAIVNTEKTKLNIPKPNIYLSSLLVFDKVKIANIKDEEIIKLKHNENFFTIQIGSDIWDTDDTFQFFYKLEGFNKEWITLPPSEREAHFTNVPPGNYIFRVKVEDNMGNRYTNLAECNLSIIPPFWNRWWFFTLLLVLLFSLSYYFWMSRMKSLRLSLFNSELNQKLLRLQMNPHFIFNSLSAIQNYIYSRQTHLAGNYLSDFAHLIRLILDNSRNELIPFDKELETISLYLNLQKLRFEDKFDYCIDVDPELSNGEYEIPPMLAQPFLENAIEHGLKNLNRKGYLSVRYQWLNKMIHFELEDNGIGLTAGKAHTEKNKPHHKSLAISICKERLETLRRKRGGEVSFHLEEIKTSEGKVKGTRVSFNIPV